MIHLDTNVVIGIANGREPALRQRFADEPDDVAISAIVLFELRFGIAKSNLKKATGARLDAFLRTPVFVLPFDDTDAAEAADIRARLAEAGTPIGPYDTLIAAQARRRSATLVTANSREFSRVPGLVLADWTTI